MYLYLSVLTIAIILFVIPKPQLSNLMNNPLGKLVMIFLLILAINKNIFLGLVFVLIYISLLENSKEGFCENKNCKDCLLEICPKSEKNNNSKDTKNNSTSNENETKLDDENSDESDTDNMNSVNLSDEELEVIQKLMSKKSKTSSCKRNCGNALLSCLDGCKLSDKMRRPVSSKEIDTQAESSNENVEPNDETKEGFTSWV